MSLTDLCRRGARRVASIYCILHDARVYGLLVLGCGLCPRKTEKTGYGFCDRVRLSCGEFRIEVSGDLDFRFAL